MNGKSKVQGLRKLPLEAQQISAAEISKLGSLLVIAASSQSSI